MIFPTVSTSYVYCPHIEVMLNSRVASILIRMEHRWRVEWSDLFLGHPSLKFIPTV